MPSPLQLGLSWLRAPANEIAFLLRSTLRWQRGEPTLANEDKHDLFAHLAPAAAAHAAAVAADLVTRFDLAALAQRSSRLTFAGNLQHLAGLERLVAAAGSPPVGLDGVVRALDVGCGDFHYASALAAWLARTGATVARPVVLRGIELDGHGIYRDGRARVDHARAHARLASRGSSTVQFQVGDAARVPLPVQDVITTFFPFLSAHACLRWGAPVSRLRPRRLFGRLAGMLAPQGWLVVVNQTAAEFASLRQLLAPLPLSLVATTPWACELVPWHARTAGQVGSLWRRQEAADRA